ncbi:MAG: hypothetical protein ACK5PF_08250 [bacterium]
MSTTPAAPRTPKRAVANVKPKTVTDALLMRIEDTGGIEKLLIRIAEGTTLTALGQTYAVSPAVLSGLLRRQEYREKYEQAKKIAAEMWVEKGMLSVETAMPETVGVAKLQWTAATYMASKLDPDTYADKAGVQVNVNLGQLHLDALRTINAEKS